MGTAGGGVDDSGRRSLIGVSGVCVGSDQNSAQFEQ